MPQSIEFIFGTKAESLRRLGPLLKKSSVPDLVYFSTRDWIEKPSYLIQLIQEKFGTEQLIVRSSAVSEDGAHAALAGQFLSVLGIDCSDQLAIANAVNRVIESYAKQSVEAQGEDQVIVQQMVDRVLMSGVLFTQEMNTGAPYFVINYDDESGATDTVTSGGVYSNRTLYVFRDAIDRVRSKRFKCLLGAVKEVESITQTSSLDIEFTVTSEYDVKILQVRPITTKREWDKRISTQVGAAIHSIENIAAMSFGEQPGLLGGTTIFGQMPDWNPAEIIGSTPRPLAFSLYRHLITDEAWQLARVSMGYKRFPKAPLLVSLGGHPYVDVRKSFNSYLPSGLDPITGTKLVDGWLARLSDHPELHDKVEFEVAQTCFSFDFDKRFTERYGALLKPREYSEYREKIVELTSGLIEGRRSSLTAGLQKISELEKRQILRGSRPASGDISEIILLLDECITYGTLPFAVLARHAFIGQDLLKSLVRLSILSEEESSAFLFSIKTVAGELAQDFWRVSQDAFPEEEFFKRYGHLRPGTYDILSPRYDQKPELFDFNGDQPIVSIGVESAVVTLKKKQIDQINRILAKDQFKIGAEGLFRYIQDAVAARELAKFVFSKNLSDALEGLARWGLGKGLSLDEVSYLDFGEIVAEKSKPITVSQYRKMVGLAKKEHQVAQALRLPQLLCDVADASVIPLQVSVPNFVTSKIVQGKVVRLTSDIDISEKTITNLIVLIENADPGFDWIFTHKPLALATKYGGVNSHMAIRCAEFGIPAAIGCGEQIYERIGVSRAVEINCTEKHIRPIGELG